VRGALDNPVFSGDATITGGRIRYVTLPHSLEAINGRLLFDAQGIRVDDVRATLGGGTVRFDGRIGLKGFEIGDVDLSATGEQMRLRYPEDFRSNVDAQLTLHGNTKGLELGGTVTINDAVYEKRFESNVDIFSLTSGGGVSAVLPAEAPTIPVRYNVKVVAPGTLRLDNNLARITARADLSLGGTYDHPALYGHMDIDRGSILFEGNQSSPRGTIASSIRRHRAAIRPRPPVAF
jgi:autotransporter translocation and assembly factor TamB